MRIHVEIMLVLPSLLLGGAGVLAGALTTLAGLGGGMLLVATLSLLWDPATALAVTAPALLVGNAHRLWLFRRGLDRGVGLRFALGAIPGAFVGGLLAAALPAVVLHVLLIAITAAAIARARGWWQWRTPPSALAPIGGVAGMLTATTGGGGLLVTPMFLAHGLRGDAFIATSAAAAVAMHVGRIAAYGASGLVSTPTLASSAVLAVAILVGNVLGRRFRHSIGTAVSARITWATLIVALALAVAGLV